MAHKTDLEDKLKKLNEENDQLNLKNSELKYELKSVQTDFENLTLKSSTEIQKLTKELDSLKEQLSKSASSTPLLHHRIDKPRPAKLSALSGTQQEVSQYNPVDTPVGESKVF